MNKTDTTIMFCVSFSFICFRSGNYYNYVP